MIRVLSYTVSALAIAVIMAFSGFSMAYKYRMAIEYDYQRAFAELSDHVNNINIQLQKGMYVSTPYQLSGISTTIWSESNAAKADIAQLSATDMRLEKTTKFISQAGDYANSLSQKVTAESTISAKDRNQIQSLYKTSVSLSDELSDLMNQIQGGQIHLFKTEKAAKSLKSGSQAAASLTKQLESIENSFANLPSMIYDGPFSDSVLNKKSLMTADKPEISKEDAVKAAAKFLQTDPSKLKGGDGTIGYIASYNFTAGNTSISVSKKGGYVVRMLNSRTASQTKFNTKAAQDKAISLLNANGIASVAATYTMINRNVCLINFAWVQDGVICYPDLIKVGVALDTGEIVSYDATGYLMNHTTRKLPAVKYSEAKIRSLINPSLTVKSVDRVIIPTGGGSERYCYEFKCSKGGQMLIDYFNVNTGLEERLLVLLNTPGGTLPLG